MNNFLNFIVEDIEIKKTMLSSMPLNTANEIKKFNNKIESILDKYNEYKEGVKRYIIAKNKSFDLKVKEKDTESLKKKVENLRYITSMLNPTNTFYEKLEFDKIFFDIDNYSNFSFKKLNEILSTLLDKFSLVSINLNSDDFEYTCYVKEYMQEFLEIRNTKKDYTELSDTFERIYWSNPDIIDHIKLNFRKLVKKHTKTFENYIEKLQHELLEKNDIKDYRECKDKYRKAYLELKNAAKDNINDIIEEAKKNTIDINNYFIDSKTRIAAYESLSVEPLKLDDKDLVEDFYDNLDKLRSNIEEYDDYIKFLPVFDTFKKEYSTKVESAEKSIDSSTINLKSIESKINEKEEQLEKISKKMFNKSGLSFLEFNKNNSNKQQKIESVKIAKELQELYKEYDQEFFNSKCLSILNSSMTASDLLNLYFSYDYFKKNILKQIFNLSTYDEIIESCSEFDEFAINPRNIITNSIYIFEDSGIDKVIINKYRLNNINLNVDMLDPNNLTELLNKIDFLLRIDIIDKSEITVEKIWFIVKSQKVIEN